MAIRDVHTSVVLDLEGNPTQLHASWTAPNGQVRHHTEHLDQGATYVEALRCCAAIRRVVRRNGELNPFL